MTQLSNETLKLLNSQGFIVGPCEDEQLFLKRVEALKDPSSLVNKLGDKALEKLPKISIKDFDLHIDWCLGKVAKKYLIPWSAAETIIYEDDQGIFPIIKLHQLKRQDEALRHELLHAARCAFDEKIFEELLAFKTSKYPLRRYFGATLRSNKEIILFLVSIVIASVFSACGMLNDHFAELLFIFPLVVIFFLLLRLIKHQRILSKALKAIKYLFPNDSPLSIVFRLTDEEIFLFSTSPYEKLLEYITTSSTLRWKQILSSYG